MRRSLIPLSCLVAMSLPATALAQDPNCPPGAWFCEDTEVEAPPTAAPAPAPAQKPDKPAPTPKAAPPTTVVIPPPAAGTAPPPVVVYQPVPNAPPPQVIIVAPGAPRPRYVHPIPPPPPKRPPWHPEWGLNLRLEGVGMGHRRGAAEDAGMGGIGLSLRYRPVPAFAIDGGIDLVGGKDYNGFERTELPISVSGILFVNPRSKVQFYFLGGMNITHATVKSDSYSPLLAHDSNDQFSENDSGYQTEYSYFGGHGGIGLEFRLSHRVALNVDLLGFVRERTDDGTQPEFVDPATGRTTNTSGGALFRGGLTIWW